MPRPRPEPIVINATSEATAAVIFLHGLGDDGESFRDLANQLQGTGKLNHVKWVLPTAKENRDAMSTAWYAPTGLSARPAPRPELEEDEDEDGFLESSKYISGIIDGLVKDGIPVGRIVLAGFSQGSALSLFIGLSSKYAGQFAGIVGLMGYLPLPDRLEALRAEHAPDSDITKQAVLICRGTQDLLLPKRFHELCMTKLSDLGVKAEFKEHSVGYSISGAVIGDMFIFLQRVIGT